MTGEEIEHEPDLCMVDVRMPPSHTDEGLRAAIEIRRMFLATAMLVLSQYVEERYASELPEGDVAEVGYLLKDRVRPRLPRLDPAGGSWRQCRRCRGNQPDPRAVPPVERTRQIDAP